MASTSAEQRRGRRWSDQLAALGLTPSKALGQNFLHDRGVVRRITEIAAPSPDDTVLEIGPGLGVMTSELATLARRVVAVELDPRLVALLRDTMPDNVTVIEADALTIDPAALAGPDYLVAANLPYSVGNAILRRLQEANPPPRSLTVMVQREVALRMTASPPAMSLLAVAVQFYGAPRLMLRVGAGAFVPPPNVDSAVVRINTLPPRLSRDTHAAFFHMVTAGFGQRRKQLRNTLSTGLGLARERAERVLLDAAIEPTERAERLTVGDWLRVFAALREGQ